ncbi:MAG TPA: hypothetical protein ENN30_00155 [Candidatus Woesearchaeota archaeon]|nr:hypothetical protein [Candidatus Woesearchaeota archaeon]
MKILSKKEIKKIEDQIESVYGSDKVLTGFVVLSTSKEGKIWITNTDALKLDLSSLRVNAVGLYFCRLDKGKLRLSIEGAQIIAQTANKNIAEISHDSVWDYLRGFDITTETKNLDENTYVLVKHKEDILGIAKHIDGKLHSVLPKSRKLISLTKPDTFLP